MKEREKFGSRLGFILVSAGCAVGLGNVWKFPYMAGQYGGSIFIIIYLCFLLLLGIPVMICEFSVGRGSRQSIASSFRVLEPEGTKTHHFGVLGIIGNYMLMMFYTVVAGWMLFYFYKSCTGALKGLSPDQVADSFGKLTQSPGVMIFWMVLAVLISFGICTMGLKNGVERVTKVMMIALLGLMVVMIIRVVTLKGSGEGFAFYLVPDIDAFLKNGVGNVCFAALSQAFFTLSLGVGSMAIFGSYMKKNRTIPGEAVSITILDTCVALMAGMIVIPSCFAFGVEQTAGPSLIFISLPNVFNSMPGGQFWGAAFFLFMSFAALSTVIAVFENILSFGMDLWGWSRKRAVRVNIVAIILFSTPCALGFNLWSGFQPFGEGSGIMDLEDFIISNNILPLGALTYVLFCCRKFGWGWENFFREANTGKGLRMPAIRGYMMFVIPAIIILVYVKGYWDFFTGFGINPWIGMAIATAMLILIAYINFYRKKGTEPNGLLEPLD